MGVVKAPMCTTLPKRIYRTIMKPRINIITVGVDNLEKSLAFYREGLGLPSKGIVATEFHDEISGADGAIAMFELQNGLILSLYPRTGSVSKVEMDCDYCHTGLIFIASLRK